MKKQTIGNKAGQTVRQFANYAAYGLMTVVHAAQFIADKTAEQSKEFTLGLKGVDTSRTRRRS